MLIEIGKTSVIVLPEFGELPTGHICPDYDQDCIAAYVGNGLAWAVECANGFNTAELPKMTGGWGTLCPFLD